MSQPARRQFLQSTLAAASVSAFAGVSTAAVDEKSAIRVALIGCGGMGGNHLRLLSARKDVVVSWVCDVDQERLAAAVKTVEENSSTTPKSTNDLRKVLDDPSVEAVFIATPDHWHTPAALLALDAGKHVYVEKPCCHNVREGRLLADAVKRTGLRLQVGTQSRSTDCVRDGIERIRRGDIGEILVAKAWNSQKRGSIGKSEPGTPPAHLDFDTWLGPAPVTPWRPNLLHAVWRWWYNFGCGDMGNDGVHDIDVAVWGLGVETHPSRVACFGGKTFFDDDMQFPDTQYAVCEYPVDGVPAGRCKQLIFEQRIWSPYVQEGYENGAAFYGTQGQLVMGHSVGWKLYGPKNKLIAERTGGGDVAAHHQNFFDCIRDPSKNINASVDAGRWSATIVHLANIAARTDSILHFDPQTERIIGNEKADSMLARQYRDHWGKPNKA
ncbi:MAG: Gfo/Idh/MocA family oxidoreductase [Planctomycetaceae bacterium]